MLPGAGRPDEAVLEKGQHFANTAADIGHVVADQPVQFDEHLKTIGAVGKLREKIVDGAIYVFLVSREAFVLCVHSLSRYPNRDKKPRLGPGIGEFEIHSFTAGHNSGIGPGCATH
jgi:hypothetical protein